MASNHDGLQDIADRVAQFFKLARTPTVLVKPTVRGWAHLRTGTVTIPDSVLGQPEAYQRYYVAHEVVHFYAGPGHRAPFKQAEADMLDRLFGIVIVTSRAGNGLRHRISGRLVYPVALLDRDTLGLLWSRDMMRQTSMSPLRFTGSGARVAAVRSRRNRNRRR